MSKLLLSLPAISAVFLIFTAAEASEPAGLIDWMIPIIVIILLIILNGIFVAAEFAIIGTRPSQLEVIQEENAAARQVFAIVDDSKKQDQYIATAQLGITIASLGLAIYGEKQFEHLLVPVFENLLHNFGIEWSHTFIETITTFVIVLPIFTYLHVVFGEMIPKALALSRPVDVALRLNNPMSIFRSVMGFLVVTLNAIGNGVLRILDVPPAEVRLHSPAEIEQIVLESRESGLILDEEEEIIRNIFDFSERRVGQVMTPRPRVEAFPINVSYQKLVDKIAESNHTRFPIYENDIDHVLGVVHMRDMIAYMISGKPTFDIKELISGVPAVPQDMMVEEMLEIFRSERIHMATVLDDRGGMAGIVTLEDLVEEVVGEVRDEFDMEDEPYTEIGDGIVEVAGDVLIEMLIDRGILPTDEELPDVDTVGGLITTRLGGPAKIGDMIEIRDNLSLTVMEIQGLAVTRARIIYEKSEPDH
ncbi:MAG: hemolysin family protein [Chloroflexota bacterium]